MWLHLELLLIIHKELLSICWMEFQLILEADKETKEDKEGKVDKEAKEEQQLFRH